MPDACADLQRAVLGDRPEVVAVVATAGEQRARHDGEVAEVPPGALDAPRDAVAVERREARVRDGELAFEDDVQALARLVRGAHLPFILLWINGADYRSCYCGLTVLTTVRIIVD